MEPSKTTVLLCSGAWHTAKHLEPPTPFLKSYGYKVVPRPLPTGSGTGTTFADDLTAIETAIRTELAIGQSVVIAAHSLAGRPAATAVSNILASADPSEAQGKIAKLIFVASFLRQDEMDVVTQNILTNAFMAPGEGTQAGLLIGTNSHQAFFNDMSPADAQPFIDALSPLVPSQGPNVPDEEWKVVPAFYMLCALDMVVPVELQHRIAEAHGLKVVGIEAGHDPFVSRPEEFARLVDMVVRE